MDNQKGWARDFKSRDRYDTATFEPRPETSASEIETDTFAVLADTLLFSRLFISFAWGCVAYVYTIEGLNMEEVKIFHYFFHYIFFILRYNQYW